MVNMKENNNLCFSNKERQTFSYNKNVKLAFKFSKRMFKSVLGSLSLMASTNNWVNHNKEYWYIGSTRAKSVMQKNNVGAR